MPDIVTIGEALIDLTQPGETSGYRSYAADPGGAPANVAVAAARLGAKTAFIGKVGQDAFGGILKETLRENRVDISAMYETTETPTTLAVVSVDPHGERSFAFYRSPGADTLLTGWEAIEGLQTLGETPAFFHFGSVSLTADPSRSAVLECARHAKDSGVLLSYDPNYRASLWTSRETALEQMKAPLGMCDIVKLAEEELELLTGTDDPAEGSLQLYRTYHNDLILITLGAKGAFYRMGNTAGYVPGCRVQVADTNGAGDTFLGAILSRLIPHADAAGLSLSSEQLEAALACTRSGAISAMPRLEEVEAARDQYPVI